MALVRKKRQSDGSDGIAEKEKVKKRLSGLLATQKPSDVAAVEPVEQKQKVRLDFPSEKAPLSKASFFVKLAMVIIALMMLIVSVKLLMDYSAMLEEKEQKKAHYSSLLERIDELNYYIDSPMDEYYVHKFAWEIFHLVPSNQKVVIVSEGN